MCSNSHCSRHDASTSEAVADCSTAVICVEGSMELEFDGGPEQSVLKIGGEVDDDHQNLEDSFVGRTFLLREYAPAVLVGRTRLPVTNVDCCCLSRMPSASHSTSPKSHSRTSTFPHFFLLLLDSLRRAQAAHSLALLPKFWRRRLLLVGYFSRFPSQRRVPVCGVLAATVEVRTPSK